MSLMSSVCLTRSRKPLLIGTLACVFKGIHANDFTTKLLKSRRRLTNSDEKADPSADETFSQRVQNIVEDDCYHHELHEFASWLHFGADPTKLMGKAIGPFTEFTGKPGSRDSPLLHIILDKMSRSRRRNYLNMYRERFAGILKNFVIAIAESPTEYSDMDIDVPDGPGGNTALQTAISQYMDIDVVMNLLKAGADPAKIRFDIDGHYTHIIEMIKYTKINTDEDYCGTDENGVVGLLGDFVVHFDRGQNRLKSRKYFDDDRERGEKDTEKKLAVQTALNDISRLSGQENRSERIELITKVMEEHDIPEWKWY